jgi:hypothetical protein
MAVRRGVPGLALETWDSRNSPARRNPAWLHKTARGCHTRDGGAYSRRKVVAAAAVEQSGFHAALLESAGRSRTGTSRSAQLFGEVFVTMDDPVTLFNVGFRGESSAAFTGPLERRIGGRFRLRISRRTSFRLQFRLSCRRHRQTSRLDNFTPDKVPRMGRILHRPSRRTLSLTTCQAVARLRAFGLLRRAGSVFIPAAISATLRCDSSRSACT